MKISTRGRYAIRVMLDLAEHNTGEYIPLMDIAKRQEVSEKYLEAIVGMLSRNGLVISLRGKGGGYQLARQAKDYNMAEILRLTEGSLAPIPCLEDDARTCDRAAFCKTLNMWRGLMRAMEDYLEGVSLQELLDQTRDVGDYVI